MAAKVGTSRASSSVKAKKPKATTSRTTKATVPKKGSSAKPVANSSRVGKAAKPSVKTPVAKAPVPKKKTVAVVADKKKSIPKGTKKNKPEVVETIQGIQKEEDLKLFKEASTAQTLLSYGVQPYSLRAQEQYMSDEQLAHFRHLLNVWKNALLQGGDETIHDLKESAEVPADISDQATQEETFALRLRTRDRERKLIKKIDESLQLIDNKEYGFCEECGIEIGIRRLEARPTATLCIDCKTLDEVREKQGR